MAQPDDANPAATPSDVAVLGGPTDSGDGVKIVRLREGQVEVGELRASEDGKPILGEQVRLHPRADHPGLFDVEVLARGPLAPRRATDDVAAKGPAKVATAAYRSGWDAIFGAPPRGGSLPS